MKKKEKHMISIRQSNKTWIIQYLLLTVLHIGGITVITTQQCNAQIALQRFYYLGSPAADRSY